MKRKGKIGSLLMGFFLFVFVAILSNNVYADFWSDAYTWYQGGNLNDSASNAVSGLVSELSGYIKITGTAVIVIATIVLGIKYILGTSADKATAKESLMNLLVACVFFFGWSNISTMFISGKNFVIYQGASDYNSAVLKIYYLFKFIAEIVAVIAIIYVGVKYIFSGATGRADLKDKSWMFVIGIILVFSAIQVLTFISDIIVNSTAL